MSDTSPTLSHMEDTLAHYGVKGMRWGVRRNVKVLSAKDGPDGQAKLDKQVARAKAKGKSVIVGDTKKMGKEFAEPVETLIRANNAKRVREMNIEMDKVAHNSAIGAMAASYIKSGVKPSKAYDKALKATKDTKQRRLFEKRIEKAEKLSAKIESRMNVKYGEAKMQIARMSVQQRDEARRDK